MPFAKSNLMVIFFVAHSVLIPAFLLLRFVILTPIRSPASTGSSVACNACFRAFDEPGIQKGSRSSCNAFDENLGDGDVRSVGLLFCRG